MTPVARVSWRRRAGIVATVGLALTGLAGCGEGEQRLRVGSKDFTESLILGELIAQVAESRGIAVDREIPYGGTFDNIEALKRGDIDVYPEYNGTGLILLGQPPIADGDESTARVKELYDPLGLIWGEKFGFENDYAILMLPDRAEEAGVATISDLEKLDGLRMGIDDEFQDRPVDGYSPMMRRYGLDAEVAIVTEDTAEGKAELYKALIERQVDVVEGFLTDGQIAEYGLVVLEDDLDFFPTYQPAPLVRRAAGQRFAELMPALAELGGAISTEAMQQLNADVELDGQDPATVAQRFLAEAGLIEADDEPLVAELLPVAVGGLDAPSVQVATALSAVRKAYRGRDVDVKRVADPLQALITGDARLAVAGAESFYALGDDVFPQPRGGAEAVGVVGFDLVHLIARRDGGPRSLADVERLAVGEAGGDSERTAKMVLTSLGLIDQIELVNFAPDDGDALSGTIEALNSGEVDALFMMTAAGHPEIASLLATGRVVLLGVPEWQTGNNLVRFPFLRVARIAADTYEGMSGPVDTIGAQVVLAGPTASGDAIGTAGPGSAAVGEILPLAATSIVELNSHLATGEGLDPTIPSAAILRPQPKAAPEAINPSPARSITNLIVILVMIYLISLYFRRGPVRRRKGPGGA
jgi:glycine betaine/choline ABC-type transport system substrate-binding protein